MGVPNPDTLGSTPMYLALSNGSENSGVKGTSNNLAEFQNPLKLTLKID